MNLSTSKTIRWIAAGVFVLALGLLAIFRWMTYSVTLNNEAPTTLSNAQIFLGNDEIWTGAMKAGETHTARAFAKSDGAVRIAFEANGKRFSQEFGYVTAGPGDDIVVVVMPSLELKALQ